MQQDKSHDDEMLSAYDFSGGQCGKYAEHYANGSHAVLLSPDVAEAFPDAEAVNNALRALLTIARKSVASAA